MRLDPWILGLLLVGLVLRLIGLDEPIVDQQAWRQADTAAMARNFFEEGLQLFQPRVDWRGTTSGVVETNFPLYPWLVACLYTVAGQAWEGWARLLAAAFSTLTALPLYGLARRLQADPEATPSWPRCAAALYLILPLSWFFGRAIMPEALMVLLSVTALWSLQRWLEAPSPAGFLLAAASAGLCFAVKVPTLYLGFPLVALAVQRHGAGFLRRPSLWLYLVLVLLPPVLWHRHALDLFEETGLTFGIFGSSGYDKWDHALLLSGAFWGTLGGRFLEYVWTPAGALLVLAGVIGLWPPAGDAGRRRLYLYAWLGGLIAYVLLVPEGNRKLHYYQIPFVPVGALFAGAPLAALLGSGDLGGRRSAWLARLSGMPRRLLAAGLLVAVVAGSVHAVRHYYRPTVRDYYLTCRAGARALASKLPADALLLVGDLDDNAGAAFRAQSPTLLYYAHRKGWQITPDEFSGARLDSFAARGADFFVVPGGFVVGRGPFWQELLRRGVGTAASWPQVWHDGAAFLAGANRHPGPERHLLVVRLSSMEGTAAERVDSPTDP